MTLSSNWSLVNTDSRSPPQSLQVRNFSTIHPANPAGESSSGYPMVWGLVPWIFEYPESTRE